MRYQSRLGRKLSADELAVYEGFGFSEKFARLLFIRGIDTQQKVKEYFDISLSRLHDPFLLKGMREAVDRINAAIAAKERILIVGDYDADGISSVAILYKYLLSRHVSTRYFLPDRNDDGYGLNVELIQKLNERFSPNLLITVDSGISCYKEVEYAKSLGIDVIVTDHHTIPEVLPDCVCINPKFTDQEYPFNALCGAGVALKLVQALGGLDTAAKYLDICAIATVADIVPLVDENRVIVTRGLEMLNNNSLPSVSALSKSCNIWGKITSTDISFKLGPKINASGRMGNAKRGLDIILEQDEAEIAKIITSLNNYNLQRQKLCNTIFDEVDAMVEEKGLDRNSIIIAANEAWESGVLGIVSARITEKYGKPSIVFGRSENVYKGSSRSVGEINIVKTIELFSDMILTYGGHSMAAGLSVSADNFDEFVAKITAYVNENYRAVDLSADKFYDFELAAGEINSTFIREIEKLEPMGCDNPTQLFITTVHSVRCSSIPNFPQHLKFSHHHSKEKGDAGTIQFVYFNGVESNDVLSCNSPKKLVFEFQKLFDGNQIRAIVKNVIAMPHDAHSYAHTLATYIRGKILVDENDIKFITILNGLSCDRDIFVRYYRAIANMNKANATDAYSLYGKVDNNDLNLYQFIFCATVFAELKILGFSNDKIVINDKISTDLSKSVAYNFVKDLDNKVEVLA